MAKRSKKDINQISAKSEIMKEPTAGTETGVPSLLIDGAESKSKSVGRSKTSLKTGKTGMKKLFAAQEDEDPELTALLLQVDKMLTEMTQSKWLASDWPAKAID